jgi:predicted MPP superfamily phosphohydrolase
MVEGPVLPRLISAAIWIAAATCLFLLLLNRWLILMPDGKRKQRRIAGALLVLLLGAILMGWLLGLTTWILIPATMLLALLVGEARRAVIRTRSRGAPPVSQENASLSLKHPFTTTDLRLARFEVPCPAWSGNDLVVAHISDLHVNDDQPPAYFMTVVEQVNRETPDLILITGDFVSDAQFAPLLPGILSSLKSRLGTYAILGNHDYWAGAEAVAEAVQSAGVVLLGNGCQEIGPNPGQTVQLCGCEDPWGSDPWQEQPARGQSLRLALTHTPDNVYRLSRAGFDAIFAGHYHAGQLRLPWAGSIVVPSVYGRRFDHGHFVVNDAHLFVTAGVGAAMPAFRIYCQPDVYVVRFRSEPARQGKR